MVTNADRRHSLNLPIAPSSSSPTIVLRPLSTWTLSLKTKAGYSSHQCVVIKVNPKFILIFTNRQLGFCPNL